MQTIDPRKGATSASNALADKLCPGRHLAQRGLPDNDSKDAASGRAVHAALFKRDPTGLTVEQLDVYHSICKLEQQFLEAFFGPDWQKVKTVREERLWVKFKDTPNGGTVEFQHSGQPDVVHRYGTQAFVMEYKTLPGEQEEASTNLQLRDQVALVAGNYSAIEGVAAVVLQPLVSMQPVPALYDKPNLDTAIVEMYQRVIASNNPDAERRAGSVQCNFCKAKLLCQQHNVWAGQMVPGMLNILEVPVHSWTPEQRTIFMDRQSAAGKWLEEVKAAMKEGLAKDPNFVPGYELKPGSKREVVTDPAECYRRFQGLGGTQEQFLKAVVIGKTKLKKALNELTGAVGMQLDKAIGVLTKDIVQVSRNAPSIVRKGEKSGAEEEA